MQQLIKRSSIIGAHRHKFKMILILPSKCIKDMKIDFLIYILHALHVLHGKIKYLVFNVMTLD